MFYQSVFKPFFRAAKNSKNGLTGTLGHVRLLLSGPRRDGGQEFFDMGRQGFLTELTGLSELGIGQDEQDVQEGAIRSKSPGTAAGRVQSRGKPVGQRGGGSRSNAPRSVPGAGQGRHDNIRRGGDRAITVNERLYRPQNSQYIAL